MSDEKIKDTDKISKESLLTKRDDIAERLYATKYGEVGHAALESQFNAVERDLFLRDGGKPSEWKDKHDVRHVFKFSEGWDTKGIVEQRAEMATLPEGKGEYTMLPPDQVINWRNTKIGQTQDAALRAALKKEKIDDAGHLIALFLGADPAERKNVAAQNCVQNQAGGSWFVEEQKLKKELEAGSISRCRLRVVVNYTLDDFNRRGYAWHMDASGVDSNEKPRIFNGNLYHLNPVQHSPSRGVAYERARDLREIARNRSHSGPVKLTLLK
jgi:hypothetical protein